MSKKCYFTDMSIDLKQYIFSFMPLCEYNHIQVFFRVDPNYELYFKRNSTEKNLNFIMLTFKNLITVNLVKYMFKSLNFSTNYQLILYSFKHCYTNLFLYCYQNIEYEIQILSMLRSFSDSDKKYEVIRMLHRQGKISPKLGEDIMSVVITNKDLEAVLFLRKELNMKITRKSMGLCVTMNGIASLFTEQIYNMRNEDFKLN